MGLRRFICFFLIPFSFPVLCFSNSFPSCANKLVYIKPVIRDLAGKTTAALNVDYDLSSGDNLIYERPKENEHKESYIKNTTLFQGREIDYETGLYYFRNRHFNPDLGRFMQADPLGYHDSMNLYQAMGNNPVNFADPMGENIFKDLANTDWKFFLGKTGHELWNIASLGTLNKVESQGNLGTVSGVLQSTGSAVASVSNVVTFGLQDEIYYEQMNGGAGLKNILKGTMQASINLTPINEVKTILSPKADIGQKIAAACMVISKAAGYAAAVKGYQQARLKQNVLQNIAESRAARASSNFSKHIERVSEELTKSRRPVVIGEDMPGRVIPAADKFAADYYQPRNVSSTNLMENNRNWINTIMDNEIPIIDRGPAPFRTNFPEPTSPFYYMELNQIKIRNYSLYTRIFE